MNLPAYDSLKKKNGQSKKKTDVYTNTIAKVSIFEMARPEGQHMRVECLYKHSTSEEDTFHHAGVYRQSNRGEAIAQMPLNKLTPKSGIDHQLKFWRIVYCIWKIEKSFKWKLPGAVDCKIEW